MNSPLDMLMQRAIQNNPNLANNPNSQRIIQILQSGDSKAGEELARNICQSLGMSPEQAYQQAIQGFRGKGMI